MPPTGGIFYGGNMYISNTNFKAPIELPDGQMALNVGDVDRYLKQSNTAMASDYSDFYRQNVKYNHARIEKNALFAIFINNYKRTIWNGK